MKLKMEIYRKVFSLDLLVKPLMVQVLLLTLLLGVARVGAEPAEVQFSDGSTLAGEITIMGTRPLMLRTADSKIQKKFQLGDLIGVYQQIETESMNRPWLYTESGKTDKTYLEGEYPFVNFLTEVELISGERLRGHIISSVLVLKTEAGQKHKIFLNRQLKGKVGETLDTLVYPVSVRLTGASKVEAKPVSGRVAGYGKLEHGTLLDTGRGVVIPLKCTPEGEFESPPLLPGEYELYLGTDRVLLYGMGGEKPAPEELEKIRQMVPRIDDFFNDRYLVDAVGKGEHYIRALIYKRRGDYHAASQYTPDGGYVWHLDVWSFHSGGSDWNLESRQIPVRVMQPCGATVRELIRIPRLGKITPGQRVEIDAMQKEDEVATFIRHLD